MGDPPYPRPSGAGMEGGLAGDGAGMGIKCVPAMGDGAGMDFRVDPPHISPAQYPPYTRTIFQLEKFRIYETWYPLRPNKIE